MMNKTTSGRIMIAAPRSRSGKTTITCALLQALKERGLDPVSFKCGPDYIDPMFHEKVLGIEGRNLDTFFAGKEGVQNIAAGCSDRYAVIEGVMGLFDGLTPEGIWGSSYEVATILKSPIILVVDASGVGRTVISLIKGMLLDDTEHLIKGVILNNMTDRFFTSLKPVLEKELSAMRSDVKLLGYFPKNKDISIDSRHLGLQLPGEIDGIQKKIAQAASLLEKSVNVDEIISLMQGAETSGKQENESTRSEEEQCKQEIVNTRIAEGQESNDGADENVDINTIPKLEISCSDTVNKQPEVCDDDETLIDTSLAVARDEAFSFYYRENLELFEKLGVRIKFFSPIRDEKLPENINGLLLGGGYPENYLEELSRNKTLLSSIKNAIDAGIPSLAECGGFMYLHRSITDIDGRDYEMVGAIDGECHYTGHLVRFGYMEIEKAPGVGGDSLSDGNLLAESLVGMRGHEFHYFDSSFDCDGFVAGKPNKDVKWNCMVNEKNGFWGFPHFYYNSNPRFIRLFVDKMAEAGRR